MKYLLLLISFTLLLTAGESNTTEEKLSTKHEKPLSVAEKKRRFFALVVPSAKKVYEELNHQFLVVKANMHYGIGRKEIEKLKKIYKVTSDKDLLLALKPHPVSITLAQAAMESAWGTSRFFKEANNLFGMWSRNPKDKRIAANEKRGGKHTIWLRKFDSVDESIREYYKTMGRAKAYKKFREYRYNTDDVFEIIKGLDHYSEIGEKYVQEIAALIRYNNLTQYD